MRDGIPTPTAHAARRPNSALALAAVLLLGTSLVPGACGPVAPGTSSPAAGSDAADGSGPADGTTPRSPGPCLEREARLLHYARRLATDPDPRLDAVRRRFHLETASASEVEQVSDPVLCMRAASAYRDALDRPGAPPAVAVIRVGDRYIVTSRVGGSTSREFAWAVVLDDALDVISTFRR